MQAGLIVDLLMIHTNPDHYDYLTVRELGHLELIEPHVTPGRFKPTEKGLKFIEMLKEVPLPEQRWIDPRKEN